MIERLPCPSAAVLGFKLTGKLRDSDYQVFVPAVEAALRAHGKLRLLAQFHDFEGWDMHAAWDDFKFGAAHYADFDRIAMVGEQRWQAWMARLCKPFTRAEVRYFDAADLAAAWAWVQAG